MDEFFSKLKIIFADIKIQHTVFALPFAVMGAFMASDGFPALDKLGWILVAMFGARSAAMAFNRIVDARFDKANPRTRGRALPAGKVAPFHYWVFLVFSSALLAFASAMLNRLALMLSPVALALVFFYSLTKRFTSLSHLFLGLALSAAPVGAWVAIREEISLSSLVLGAAVVFWLAGFDIIYSCQDEEFDRKNRLHSVPQRFGVPRALQMAGLAHLTMVMFLLALFFMQALGKVYLAGALLTAGLLAYEHSLVKGGDLSKVNVAFFNVNGCISILLMVFTIVDRVWA
ncbi:MAG: UbiA family prenyltransferase [Nitrospinae bacterium]|nr:UbiA family prenyltransferase [Nitrospinota bacterium]